MVKLIAGTKGSGKSKQVIQIANDSLANRKGDVIYIDDDNRAMYEVNQKIRFIDLSTFPIDTAEELTGFLCGLISSNYDLDAIYLDGFFTKSRLEGEALVKWFDKVAALTDEHNIELTVTLNYQEKLESGLEKYLA